MTLHITRFVDRVRTAELRQQRDIPMTLREAQDLHADITKLLAALATAQEALQQRGQESVIQVSMEGGDF